MFNPIEARKRLVQGRIEKSFQDNVGEQRERETTSDVVEKAYQVGDEKQFNGRNYYVHALNSKGQPMWRLKRDGAKKDEEGGGEKKTAKPEEKKSVSDHASEASDEALKRAAADEKAKPEVREAAKKELANRGGDENNSNLSAKDSKEIKRIDKKLKNLDYQMKQTIKERDADESYTPSDDPDDFDYYENTIAAQEKEIARLKKRKENILKELENRNSVGNGDSVKEKPSKAKEKFLRDVEEHGGDMWVDRFMEKNEKHFSEVLKKHGFDSWDDFQKYGEDGPDDYDKIWKKCANAIPNSAFDSSSESKATTNENDLKNNSSSNNGSVSEDDVKTFLTQKLGADDVTDELISGVMEIVNQHRAEMQKKNETINKIKQNAAESKEAKKEKSRRLKQILENGTDKHDSVFMSDNESYFKDVLSKHGFESFDDFEEWGANGADDDWDKYNKIFKTCFNKIPAEKFLKKSSFDELNSVSDLIEEIRNNR